MSVKKYVIHKGQGNFTTIPNKVLQNLNNYEALGLYCYLVSLPHNWEFVKEHLRNHANIGIKKLNTLLKILEVHELIKMVQIRGSNGRFLHFSMEVMDGTSFKINNLQEKGSPLGKKPLAVNGRTVKSDYKVNIEKENKDKKEIKISCSSDDELKSFEQFWLLYPRKQKKIDAFRIWKKNKLYEKINDIQLHLMKRLEHEWKSKEKKYIPLASTFLNGERWTDEILENSPQEFNKPRNGRDVSRAYLQKAGIL